MKSRKRQYSYIKNLRFGRRRLAILSLVVLAALGIALIISRNNSTDEAKKQTITTVSSKGEQPTPNSNTAAPGSDQTQGSGTSSGVSPSGEGPKTPYGNFVSSHSAHLNDSGFSTCLTSAGAKCQISFTKDGTSKTLDEKTTDADGAAYWIWKPQNLGLTAGSWQITATANMNAKTASTTDSRSLVIQP